MPTHCRDARRSAPKVKFSKTITEFPDYSRYANPTEIKSVSSPGQSPSHNHHGKLDGDSLRVKGESSEHIRKKLIHSTNCSLFLLLILKICMLLMIVSFAICTVCNVGPDKLCSE